MHAVNDLLGSNEMHHLKPMLSPRLHEALRYTQATHHSCMALCICFHAGSQEEFDVIKPCCGLNYPALIGRMLHFQLLKAAACCLSILANLACKSSDLY